MKRHTDANALSPWRHTKHITLPAGTLTFSPNRKFHELGCPEFLFRLHYIVIIELLAT